jgi:LmbE family N-acetylglucosaminyl deacetylase
MRIFFRINFFFFLLSFFIFSPIYAEEIDTSVKIKKDLRAKPVVVILPHQDDELFMAGAIQQYIASGRKVYAVIVSDGAASAARERMSIVLTKQQFSLARNREVVRSLGILGIPRSRIHFMNPDNLTGTKKSLYKDGELSKTADQAIKRIFKKYGDGTYVTVAGGHYDHIALEEALHRQEGISEKIFFPYIADGLTEAVTLPDKEMKKKRQAISIYEEWQPKKGRYAIGVQSVPDLMVMWRLQDKEYFYSL